MAEVDLFLVFVPLIEGEVDDPGELELIAVDQIELFARPRAGGAGKGGEFLRVACSEETGIAVLKAKLGADRLGALRADILGDGTGALKAFAFLAPEDIAEPRLALALCPGIHAVAEGSGAASLCRNGPHFGLLVIGENVGENLEARATEVLGDVFHLDGVAQIRLVGTVFAHRLVIGNAREDVRHRLAIGELFEDAAHDRFHGLEHVLLLDEAHFEVKLVEFARQAVGARVLVAEAGRDLEITVEARHHDQLLVDLRRLRQGVELALVKTRRHEEVARALGRGGRQDRRRIFGKARLAHGAAHLGDDLRALDDVLVQSVAAQVEEAVFEANVFRIIRLAKHRQRQFLRLGKHFDRAGENLHLTGRQVLVDRLVCACLHLAIDTDHPFATNAFSRLERRRIGIGDDLRHAVMIAQIDEQEAAMVAHAMHPAGQAHIRAHVGFSEFGAGMAAIAMHGHIIRVLEFVLGRGRNRPGRSARKAHERYDLSRCGTGSARDRLHRQAFSPGTSARVSSVSVHQSPSASISGTRSSPALVRSYSTRSG